MFTVDYRCPVVCLWSAARTCTPRCHGVDDVDGVDDVIDDLSANSSFPLVVERNILRAAGILTNTGRVVRISWAYLHFLSRVL